MCLELNPRPSALKPSALTLALFYSSCQILQIRRTFGVNYLNQPNRNLLNMLRCGEDCTRRLKMCAKISEAFTLAFSLLQTSQNQEGNSLGTRKKLAVEQSGKKLFPLTRTQNLLSLHQMPVSFRTVLLGMRISLNLIN